MALLMVHKCDGCGKEWKGISPPPGWVTRIVSNGTTGAYVEVDFCGDSCVRLYDARERKAVGA